MLFMVIERFKSGQADAVHERFDQKGRMLPDGIQYHASWIDSSARCFQIMEAENAEALQPWIDAWKDLVDFEVIPVLTSQDYWSKIVSPKPGM
jgi:hypothetical protein